MAEEEELKESTDTATATETEEKTVDETTSDKTEEQISDETEAKEEKKDETVEGEEKEEPASPPKLTWWQEMNFSDEDTAVKSMKEQRQWTTRVTQENAKIKRTEEAYRKYAKGELDTEDIEEYIKETEIREEQNETKQSEAKKTDVQLTKMALEIGKVKWPEIVTKENIPLLDPYFLQSTKETHLEKLEDAVEQFKKVQSGNLKAIRETQDTMKDLADGASELPAKRQDKVNKDIWDLSDENFTKLRDKVSMGLP